MLCQNGQHKLNEANVESFKFTDSRPIIYIDSQQQLLSCVSAGDKVIQTYPVSTSKHGLGQSQGSLKTPTGIHKIAQKIGDNEPIGRVFRSRIPTEEICLAQDHHGDDDVITTRILRLEGLQSGLNRGGEVDSFERYIYIHGTSDEAHIGVPASIGCIRMKNKDMIMIFDQTEINDLVIIE